MSSPGLSKRTVANTNVEHTPNNAVLRRGTGTVEPLSHEKKLHFKLYFDEWVNFKVIGFLIGLAHASRKIRKLSVEREGKPRIFDRIPLHLFIRAPKHNFKTAHARKLLAKYPLEVETPDNVSYAGLTGTIDKEGNFVPPDVLRYRGKTVVFDEVVRDRHGEATRALLQILEGKPYERKLGRTIKRRIHRVYHDGSYLEVKDGVVTVYSNFVCIMLSMYPLSYTSSTKLGDALLDRMLTVQYQTTRDQRDLIRRGLYEIDIPEFDPPEEVHVCLEDYQKILSYQDKFDPDLNPRILDNMVRAFAITGKHDEEMYGLIAKTGKARWVQMEEAEEE